MRNVLYFWCTYGLLVVHTSLALILIIKLYTETFPLLFVLQKASIFHIQIDGALMIRGFSWPSSTIYWPFSLQVSNWTAALKGPPNKTPLTLCSFFNHPRNWLHCTECPSHIIKRQAASWDGKLCLWDGVPSWSMENWRVSAEDACCFHEGMHELQRGKQQSWTFQMFSPQRETLLASHFAKSDTRIFLCLFVDLFWVWPGNLMPHQHFWAVGNVSWCKHNATVQSICSCLKE